MTGRELVIEDDNINGCLRLFLTVDKFTYLLQLTNAEVSGGVRLLKTLNKPFDGYNLVSVSKKSQLVKVLIGPLFRLLRCYNTH